MHSERLAGRHLVLLGIGHTNAHVLRMWRMNPIPNVDLTCISDRSVATYSGMLPAVLAGQTPEDQMQIDLVRLCGDAGARLIVDPVAGLDLPTRTVQFETRPPIPYDVLSIGVGSVPTTQGVTVEDDALLKIKPMQTFLSRLDESLKIAETKRVDAPIQIVVVGGGVAGIEMLMCLPGRLESVIRKPYELTLVSRSSQIPKGVVPTLQRKIDREIQRRGIKRLLESDVVRVSKDEVECADGTIIGADIVVWAAGASPPKLLQRLSLPTDNGGFLLTDATLRSVSGEPAFAVGDTGSIRDLPTPKAGVFAVRQGPVLWENVQRCLDGRPLVDFQPQRSFMRLVNLGDQAIGQWRGIPLKGNWVLKLKHWIDQRFMNQFSVMQMEDDGQMQCRGCGCKLGPDPLAKALDPLGTGSLDAEDAVSIGEPDSGWIASTDFFVSPVEDAFLSGRISALHCASDLIVSGANVRQAIANVTLPEGDSNSQQRILTNFLQGARLEFGVMGAAITSGHTIVGPRMETGFTVAGPLIRDQVLKRLLQPGDELFLTKPLGVGVLLAATMRNRCNAADYESMLKTMLIRQHPFAVIASEQGILAGTDVTGFGLAGHLLEMLDSSDVSAEIELSKLPLLPGVTEYIAQGIQSSLAPENQCVERMIEVEKSLKSDPRYSVLFDPQTCGGFLYGVSPESSEKFIQSALAQDLPSPVRIGRAIAQPKPVKLHVLP